MANIHQVISLGIGSPAGIKEFLTFGLQLGAAVTVPNVVGETQAQATTDIQALGLTVGVTSVYSGTVALGLVISQNPIGGSQVAPSSNVDIVVSLGPQPDAGQPSGGMGAYFPSGYVPMAKGIGYDKPKKKIIEEIQEIEPESPKIVPKRPILTLKKPKIDLEALKNIEARIIELEQSAKSSQDAVKLKQLQEEEAIILLLLS